ncbi:MAG: sulfotransferase family 2 domain-containing protein [Planctomycetota bacterium]
MLISDEKKFIFVHVPKTGGSSMSQALQPVSLERQSSRWYSLLRKFGLPRDYRKFRFLTHGHLRSVERIMPPEIYKEYFKFAFVRNPWDRLVSEYNALMHQPNNRRYRRVAKLDGFKGYLEYEAPRIVDSQVDMLLDSRGEIGVDFVGRFENLAADFQHVCERVGLETDLGHVNAHKHASYRTFYTDETREFVRKYWHRDIEAFDYEF